MKNGGLEITKFISEVTIPIVTHWGATLQFHNNNNNNNNIIIIIIIITFSLLLLCYANFFAWCQLGACLIAVTEQQNSPFLNQKINLEDWWCNLTKIMLEGRGGGNPAIALSFPICFLEQKPEITPYCPIDD